jgi:hypothetical protein
MTRSVIVLGTAHEFQGPKFTGHVKDPSYVMLIETSIDGCDFVFEEASGRRPTIAEELVNSTLGDGHYLDVDPQASERLQYGIPAETTASWPISMHDSPESYTSMFVTPQRLREELWIKRIDKERFSKALFIVGIGHSLSVAFRLENAGFVIEEARAYTPYNNLCRRRHA